MRSGITSSICPPATQSKQEEYPQPGELATAAWEPVAVIAKPRT